MAWWSQPQGAPSLQPCGALLHFLNMSLSLQGLPVLEDFQRRHIPVAPRSTDQEHWPPTSWRPRETSGAVRPRPVHLPIPDRGLKMPASSCKAASHLRCRWPLLWLSVDKKEDYKHLAVCSDNKLERTIKLSSHQGQCVPPTPRRAGQHAQDVTSTETQRTATRSHSCLWPSNFTTPPSECWTF